ncbi:ABC transporter ATP-binding protein [Aestuariivirga sp.]|uniref:ABC transporter ATP-binding protein n=1 Tax=Aestuariivirga sp. TaxID=2650926 RepID=UPI00301B42D4
MIDRFFTWLESLVDPFPSEQPEMPPEGFLAFCWHYTKPFWPLLLVSTLLSAVIAFLEVYLFAFLGKLVDVLAAANRASFWQDHGMQLLAMGAIALILLPILNFFSEAVSHQGLRGNYAMRIRWVAHRYVLRQSMDFFTNDFAGRVATKVMQTALGVRDAVMKFTEVLVYVIVYFLGALILVATADRWLMIPLLIWLAGYAAACWYFVPKLGKLSQIQAEMRSLVTGRVVDSYTNIPTVKLFAHTDREDGYAREGMDWMLKSVNDSMRMSTMMTTALQALSGVLIFTMSAMAIWLWYQGAITTGAIAFAVGLTLRLKAMSQWIIWEVAGLFESVGVIQDGIETIARDRTIKDLPDAKPLVVTSGSIKLEDVTFNYGKPLIGRDRPVLEGLNLNIAPGEKVGLVGRSGAGKSTLTNLLLRFYDLEKGRILIDGQDIAHVTQDSLRAAIGVVTQDTSLLHRSVIDNIRYGMPDASMAEVEAAARKAHASEFIASLMDPKGRRGYEAHVGERGVKLSGGQRQRIAIARVLLKNAPILVLDEATSALDSEVEQAIQENLYALMEGKTVIAVAHRLSTIAAMDRLVIMDKGVIVEDGTHRELLDRGGLYASLWQRQSGGFLVEDAELEAAE